MPNDRLIFVQGPDGTVASHEFDDEGTTVGQIAREVSRPLGVQLDADDEPTLRKGEGKPMATGKKLPKNDEDATTTYELVVP